jgi:hypothetical protein
LGRKPIILDKEEDNIQMEDKKDPVENGRVSSISFIYEQYFCMISN